MNHVTYEKIFAGDAGRLSTLTGVFQNMLCSTDIRALIPGLPRVNLQFAETDLQSATVAVGNRCLPLAGDFSVQRRLAELALTKPSDFEQLVVRNLPLEQTELGSDRGTVPLRLKQIMATPRIFNVDGDSATIESVQTLCALHRDKYILIATGLIIAAEEIRRALAADYSVEVIDGSVVNTRGDSARTRAIQRFQTGATQILVVTNGTMSLSEQLTRADVVIFADLPDRPSVFDQLLGRVVRPDPVLNYSGKEVQAYVLLQKSPYSIGRATWKLLETKRLFQTILVHANLTPELLTELQRAERGFMGNLRCAQLEPRLSEHSNFVKQWRLLLGRAKAQSARAEDSGHSIRAIAHQAPDTLVRLEARLREILVRTQRSGSLGRLLQSTR